MVQKIDWESQIGRRIKLRDLHVFAAVAECGNMAKAAVKLGVSQPTVSEIIGDLEYALGVRLLDRGRRGAEPTIYGIALLRRGKAAFDELKQGVREIELLTDPAAGEIWVGCPESIAVAVVSPIVQRFAKQYPRAALNVDHVNTPTLALPQLRDRSLDLVIVRSPMPRPDDQHNDELRVEQLFNDDLVVAVGKENRLSHRHKIDLADLIDEPWLLTPPGAAIHNHVAQAFRARGLDVPKVRLGIQSVALRGDLLATGGYVAAIPMSIFHLYARQFPLKLLPVKLPVRPWPVVLVTLKNRTVPPVVERFIQCARDVATSFADGMAKPS